MCYHYVIEEKEEKEEESWKPYIPSTPSAILQGYYSKDEPGEMAVPPCEMTSDIDTVSYYVRYI